MKVSFYKNAYKHVNSTKRFAVDAADVTVDAVMKSPCSVANPRLEISHTFNPTGYTYLYIQSFDRFYWVDSWTFKEGLWVCECSTDVLGTFRAVILDSRQYVTRATICPTADTSIVDHAYPKTQIPVIKQLTAVMPFTSVYKDGTIVVGIFNSDKLSVGTTSYYAFTPDNFRNFANVLMSDTLLGVMDLDTSEITNSLLKCLFNPMQYISSCMWLPFEIGSTYGTKVTEIPFGFWAITGEALRLKTLSYQTRWETNSIPQHPDEYTRGFYLQGSPYSKYWLTYNPVGTLELNPAMFFNKTYFAITWQIDLPTGIAEMGLWALPQTGGTEPICYECRQIQIGVDLNIAQSQNKGLVQSIYGGAVNVTTAGSAVGAIAAGMGALAQIGDALVNPTISSMNSNGNIAAFYGPMYIIGEFHRVTESGISILGRPVCHIVESLGESEHMGGWVMCNRPHIEGNRNMYKEDINAIETHLENGVWLE